MSKSTTIKNNKIVETVRFFNDGMTSNWRDSDGFALSKQFRHFKDRIQLRPGLVEHTGADEVYDMTNTKGDIWGLGEVSGSNRILKKASFFPSSTWSNESAADFDTGSWIFEYKNHLFYYDGSYNLNFYGDITSSPSETLDFHTSFSTSADTTFRLVKPFIHPTDGYAYFFDKSNVYQLRAAPASTSGASSWTQASIDIPDHLAICAACPNGEYINIYVYDSDLDKTDLYVWDRSVTLEDFINIVEWGSGETIYCATLEGTPFGVSKVISDFAGYKKQLNIAYYTGNTVTNLERSTLELDGEVVLGNGSINAIYPSSTNTHLYFGGPKVIIGGTERANNVYALDPRGNITIPATLGTGTGTVRSFVVENDTFLIAPSSGSSMGPINDADLVDQLIFEGEYVPGVFDGNLPHVSKQPSLVTVAHSPILTGGSVKVEMYNTVLGSWTEINTNNTAGDTRTSFNLMSDGNSISIDLGHMYRITLMKTQFMYLFQTEADIINDNI